MLFPQKVALLREFFGFGPEVPLLEVVRQISVSVQLPVEPNVMQQVDLLGATIGLFGTAEPTTAATTASAVAEPPKPAETPETPAPVVASGKRKREPTPPAEAPGPRGVPKLPHFYPERTMVPATELKQQRVEAAKGEDY